MKRIFSIGTLAMLISATTISCNNDDSGVFSKNPMERENEQKQELQELLVGATEGWKFNYFPEENGLGGFTFLMKFTKEGKVTMVSDFTEEGYTEKTTDYELQLRGTTSLVFVDETWIHELSDPINSALRTAKGFEGEFQYRYYGFDDNSIFFRGTRKFDKEFSFVRATKEDWTNFNDRKHAIATIADADAPVFRSIEIDKNGEVSKYDAMYSGVLRYLTFNDGESQELVPGKNGLGIGFTNEGILVEPGIIVDNVEYKDFKWNESTEEFISSNDSGTSVKIKNVTHPDSWPNDYKDIMFGRGQVGMGFIKDFLMAAPGNSAKFLEFVRPVDLERIQLIFQNQSVNIAYIKNDGQRFDYQARLTDTGISGKMSNGRWASSNVTAEIKDLHEVLFGYGEILLKKQRYTVQAPNSIATLYCGGIVFDNYLF